MAVRVAIKETRARLRTHRQVEGEPGPIIAAAHVGQRVVRIDAWGAERNPAIPPRLHREQMLQSLSPLARLQPGDIPFREKTEHRLLHASDSSTLDREPDEC